MAIQQYAILDWRDFDIPVGEGFTSGATYPDPSSSEVRKQLQSQHSQMKEYVNGTLVPAINNTYTKEETITQINNAIVRVGDVTPETVQNMIDASIASKQDTLVSGDNIKTVNSKSLLGSGNINTWFSFDVTNVITSDNGVVGSGDPFSFEAPSNGFIMLGWVSGTASAFHIKLNDVTIDFMPQSQTVSTACAGPSGNLCMPLKEGDTIKIERTGGSGNLGYVYNFYGFRYE